jgi:hypothetical protein
MGQFQPGMSGNPDGRPKGSSGGRVQALAALVGYGGGFPAFKHRTVTMAVTFNYVPHPAQRVIHEARPPVLLAAPLWVKYLQFKILDGLEVFCVARTQHYIAFRGSRCDERIARSEAV